MNLEYCTLCGKDVLVPEFRSKFPFKELCDTHREHVQRHVMISAGKQQMVTWALVSRAPDFVRSPLSRLLNAIYKQDKRPIIHLFIAESQMALPWWVNPKQPRDFASAKEVRVFTLPNGAVIGFAAWYISTTREPNAKAPAASSDPVVFSAGI